MALRHREVKVRRFETSW